MSKVLYRKYRPTNFSEVVGQEHIVKTLKNAVRREKIAHAYLFSGPRGIGKTTIARILAKVVNCKNPKSGEPCNECENCLNINDNKFLDLIEIDAATHTQVDKIRDLIEKINFSPTSGKYKVYIIDEVHMLSRGAFNALLKTLEEPPKHAIFILATTEIHKIPATIISRCQRFDFRRLKVFEIKERLEKIAKQEKVKVEKGVLDFIAINSNGGLRDSESLFGQILSLEDDDITLKEVQTILAIADISVAVKLIELIVEKKYSETIDYINKITDDGYDLEQFSIFLIEYCRKLMLLKISPEIKENFSSEMTEEQIAELEAISQKTSVSQILGMIRAFIKSKEEIKSSIIQQLPLELAIAEINIADKESLTDKANTNYNDKIKEPIKKITDKVSSSVKQSQNFIKKSMRLEKEEETEDNKTGANENKTELNNSNKITLDTVNLEWQDILEEMKSYNHSLTAFLKTCQPIEVKKNEIIISCKYSFHKDKLKKIENKSIIEKATAEILKADVLVKFITQDEAEKMGYKIKEIRSVTDDKKEDAVDMALDMFGGKIV
ncbi:DNA polymerase III subunit gamma/tau [Candidatus Parcubacteria bacterium]|nr:DNA polymerase III subunit gamma/tau [Candidatus Parcubacteria bacterium]